MDGQLLVYSVLQVELVVLGLGRVVAEDQVDADTHTVHAAGAQVVPTEMAVQVPQEGCPGSPPRRPSCARPPRWGRRG